MKSRGFSLVEALIAMAILGLIAVSVLPAMMTQLRASSRNEIRTAAAGTAQLRMESLRLVDPVSLPTGGAPDTETVTIGRHEYEIKTFYCRNAEYCPPTNPFSRHLTVEVYLAGQRVYDVETVYTQLR